MLLRIRFSEQIAVISREEGKEEGRAHSRLTGRAIHFLFTPGRAALNAPSALLRNLSCLHLLYVIE